MEPSPRCSRGGGGEAGGGKAQKTKLRPLGSGAPVDDREMAETFGASYGWIFQDRRPRTVEPGPPVRTSVCVCLTPLSATQAQLQEKEKCCYEKGSSHEATS